MPTEYALTLALAPTFRPNDILAFHSRDPQAIAERVSDTLLEKGMLWNGATAHLSLRFTPEQVQACLQIDGCSQDNDLPLFAQMIRRMLGLNQQIEAFEQKYAAHPELGSLIASNPGLRVPVATTPFEALTWAIIGQQISVAAATALRRRLIVAANQRHSSGLLCYPNAQQIARIPQETLRQAGLSATKTSTLQTVSQRIASGMLPLDAWALDFPDVEIVREQLLKIHGIGPWTVNYTLLRGYGWLDGSLHGDAAVRRGLQALLSVPNKVSEDEAKDWLAPFSPWRALIGAHLWAWQSSVAY